MYKTQLERKKANLNNLQERIQKIGLRREIKKVVKEQIIFERKKQQLNEGILSSLLDIGQIGLSFLGTAGDAAFGAGAIADAANAAIHFTRALAGERIHFLYGLLSLISVIPGVGDLLGKPIELIVRLGRAAGSETAIARNVGRIANFIGANQAGIISSVNRAQQYVSANRTNIKSALTTAHRRAAGRGNRPTTGRRPRTMTETSSTGLFESIVNFILNNETLQNLFANSDSFERIVRGIDGAFDQIMSILDAFTGISEEEPTELTNITRTPPEVLAAAVERLNESKVERVSLKVLF